MKKPKILVVDDNPKFSSVVRVFLQHVGHYEVLEVNRSSAALKAAREFQPDLVILDVDMPEKDGGDVASELHSDPLTKRVPVMFLSALVAPDNATMCGGTRCLSKPVNPRALVDTVRELLAAEAA